MTQEEKDLLLKDLCARLPYGVKVQYKDFDPIDLESIDQYTVNGNYLISLCKPYLRKMSSMTADELEELNDIAFGNREDCGRCCYREWFYVGDGTYELPYSTACRVLDWLNSHHFDYRGLYRGLIPKGLALEAPEGMYND